MVINILHGLRSGSARLLVTALLVTAGCSDSDEPVNTGAPTGPGSLDAAKRSLEEAGSYRLDLTMRVNHGDWWADMSGTAGVAAVDGKPAVHFSGTMDVTTLGREQTDISIAAITVSGTQYTKIQTGSEPTRWVTGRAGSSSARGVAEAFNVALFDLRQWLDVTPAAAQPGIVQPSPTVLDGKSVSFYDVPCSFDLGCTFGPGLQKWLTAGGAKVAGYQVTIDDASQIKTFRAGFQLRRSVSDNLQITMTASVADVGAQITVTPPPVKDVAS